MSEEKLGQQYLAALHQAFPGVVLDEAWQTKDQLTITVKVNYLPEAVEFLYYQQGGWLSVLFGNDERQLCGHYAVYYVLSMGRARSAGLPSALKWMPISWNSHPLRRACRLPCGVSAKYATCTV